MCFRPERNLVVYNYIDHQICSASGYREIHKSWEKSNPNKTASRTVHQQRYLKAEEKKYEEPEEPIERIAEVYILSIYIPCLLTLSYYIDYQENRRGELF